MHKRISLLLLGLTLSTAFRGQAQSTIFTYQGRLAVNGTPATGLFDMQFTIYKVEAGGMAAIADAVTPEQLAAFLRGGLPPDERADVEAHVTSCDACCTAAPPC